MRHHKHDRASQFCPRTPLARVAVDSLRTQNTVGDNLQLYSGKPSAARRPVQEEELCMQPDLRSETGSLFELQYCTVVHMDSIGLQHYLANLLLSEYLPEQLPSAFFVSRSQLQQ